MATPPAGSISPEYQAILDYSKQEAIKSAWQNAVQTKDSGQAQTANGATKKYQISA